MFYEIFKVLDIDLQPFFTFYLWRVSGSLFSVCLLMFYYKHMKPSQNLLVYEKIKLYTCELYLLTRWLLKALDWSLL